MLGEIIEDKLVFHLWHTCAEGGLEQGVATISEPCNHTDEERAIVGNLMTPELELALEKDYRIGHVYELWHWPEDQRCGDLFRKLIGDNYLNKFYASHNPNEEGLDQLIEETEKHLGVNVDRSKFGKNKPARQLAKFLVPLPYSLPSH